MRFHPGRAAITQGLAIYSWRAPGIQEAPFSTQLPLRHAALGTVVIVLILMELPPRYTVIHPSFFLNDKNSYDDKDMLAPRSHAGHVFREV
jgi:hypothetical protein